MFLILNINTFHLPNTVNKGFINIIVNYSVSYKNKFYILVIL